MNVRLHLSKCLRVDERRLEQLVPECRNLIILSGERLFPSDCRPFKDRVYTQMTSRHFSFSLPCGRCSANVCGSQPYLRAMSMLELSTMDRSHSHLQLEVVQPMSVFAYICIMKPTSFPWGSEASASWGNLTSSALGVEVGKKTVRLETRPEDSRRNVIPPWLTTSFFLVRSQWSCACRS